MNISNFDESIFKSSVKDLSEFTIDGDMLIVLIALDGKKPVKEISRTTGFPNIRLRKIIKKLSHLNLVKLVPVKLSMLNKADFDLITGTLARIVGPIAGVMVEDAVLDLGFNQSQYPVERTADLINVLSQEIENNTKRIEFQKIMTASIKKSSR